MSGFCAAYVPDGNCCDCSLLTRMLPSLALRGDRIGMWSQGSIGLAMTEWNGRSVVPLPYHPPTQDLVIAADLRLDYRSDLLATLQERGASVQGQSDIELLAAAYRAWGTACVYSLEGDYAFVLWDASRSMLFGARSLTGQRPFVFHRTARGFLCASEARQLLASGIVEPQFHAGWMASWLVEGHDSWDCTVYSTIEKLPAGHMLTFDDEHGIRIEAFWQPCTRRQGARRQQEYTEQFKRLLFAAVSSRFHPSIPCFIDVSGGLDSSSLACIAGELRRQGAILPDMYAIHASAPHSQENDDRHLAAFVAEVSALPISSLSYDELEPFRGISHPRVWTDTPAPPILFYTEFYERLFQMAAHVPIHAHIRGDFGDQLFDGSPGYLQQLAAEHRYLHLLREAWAWQQSGIISASSVLLSALASKWRHHHHAPPLHEHLPWVRQEVLKTGMQRKLAEAEHLAHLVPDPLARRLYQALLRHDDYLAQQNESTRAGLETREPYLDSRLLTFLMSSAPQNSLRFGMRKFLLREAMSGLLPEAIRTRRSKGRIARLLFEGMARSHRTLRELMITMPEELEPFVDAERLAQALDLAAYGGVLDQTPFLSVLALVLWAHRLPWCNGKLPRLEGLERFEQTRR